jgi:hypothetical protein
MEGDVLCFIKFDLDFVILRTDKTRQDFSVESSLRSHFDKASEATTGAESKLPQTDALPLDHGTFIGDCFLDGLKILFKYKEWRIKGIHIFGLH